LPRSESFYNGFLAASCRGFTIGKEMHMEWGWRPYVPVAQRRANAERHARKLAKNGRTLQPVKIQGRTIATTFWGKAWCDNLEQYSDFANRLPRGRTYARNGSIVDLQLAAGKVTAIVSGSEIYQVKIDISPLATGAWTKIKSECSQSVPSLIDLLQGKFSQGVMERLTRRKEGLFPHPGEIKMSCSCPDWALLCKHVAAVLYGVGARLDTAPELLFQLRRVDHLELIEQAVDGASLDAALGAGAPASLAGEDLEAIFGIDLDGAATPAAPSSSATKAAVVRHAARRAARASAQPKKPAKKTPRKKAAGPKSAKPKKKSRKKAALPR
jgi:uncharacterized Zn finger protein